MSRINPMFHSIETQPFGLDDLSCQLDKSSEEAGSYFLLDYLCSFATNVSPLV